MKHLCGLIVFLTIASSQITLAQGPGEYASWADEAFEQGNYQTAWTYYSKALQADSANLSLWYRMAESGRLSYNYQPALNCYRIVFEQDMGASFPLAVFWLGELSKNTGELEQAFDYYSIFLAVYNDEYNYFYTLKAKYEIENRDVILKLAHDSMPVEIEHFQMPVNTTYSEFGAQQLGDNVLLFSSIQPALSESDNGLLSNDYLSSIYISKLTPSGMTRPVLYNEVINSKKEHTANFTFNADKTRLYFNRCHVNTNYKYICNLYYSEEIDGHWSRPQRIEIEQGADEYTVTQPACYTDTAGADILYFSSDRPGGYGGLDIWYAVIKEGTVINATNAGSNINSMGDEITPFYDPILNILYFSSNWYPGIGAFDIFKSEGGLSQWKTPENIGRPFNSPANDLYFGINETDRDGYLTSNRPGSFYLKGETCCNDIFAYYLHETETIDSIPQYDSLPPIVTMETAIRELLPLNLYFHNDIPDPRSQDTITGLRYDQTYYSYVAMIDRYRKEYSKGLEGVAAAQAEADIEAFFMVYVTGGFNNLLLFTQMLTQDLENGSDVTLKVKGFCSPLTSTEYNINLAKRRIDALQNYFEWVDGGRIKPFLSSNPANGGSLTIISEPIGEALSNPLVSDNINDARNSIYSRAAAFERRIQISMYQSNYQGDSIQDNVKPMLKIDRNVIAFSKDMPIGSCITVQISNEGNSLLRIEAIRSNSEWIIPNINAIDIAPKSSVPIELCLTSLQTRPSLGMIIIESNSDDGKTLVYVKYDMH